MRLTVLLLFAASLSAGPLAVPFDWRNLVAVDTGRQRITAETPGVELSGNTGWLVTTSGPDARGALQVEGSPVLWWMRFDGPQAPAYLQFAPVEAAAIPEPGTGIAALALAWIAWRRRKR